MTYQSANDEMVKAIYDVRLPVEVGPCEDAGSLTVRECVVKAIYDVRLPAEVGQYLWAYANVETKEHAALHWDDIHFRMMEFSALKDPTESILCMMGEDGFKKGGLWATTHEKDLVTCRSCIEYIHS